ncbi:MAG: hypothetical protein K1X78_28035 [Verrucomicrobiaceae bacterium]|nr:hypothetical protein [Verrucomicrobiaceae bacterium]
MIASGKGAASKRLRAQILLAADASRPGGELRDEDISQVLGVSVPTVERTGCALCEHGLEIAVNGWPAHRKVPQGKIDGWGEAHLVAAVCRPPPAGASHWTLRMLGDHLVGLGLVESVSTNTVGRALKKTTSNPGK